MNIFRQGELYIIDVNSLSDSEFAELQALNPDLSHEVPAGFVEAPREDGEIVCAHSETGHHHVIDAPRAKRYVSPNDEMVAYLVLELEAELKHKRDHHQHGSHMLPAGIYYARLQRESSPQGWRRVSD